MGALENAKAMSQEAVIEKIKAAGLREYGVFNQPLEEKWAKDQEEQKDWQQPMKVVAALNNNDTDRALLGLLDTQCEDIIAGMQIAAYALDTEKLELYVPEGESELRTRLAGAVSGTGIQVFEAMVNVRECRGGSINHIATMAALGQLFADSYEAGAWMSVYKDGACGELLKVAYGTAIKDIPGVPTEDVKGVLVGSALYDASGLDLVVEADTNIGNGVIKVFTSADCIIDQQEKLLMTERRNGCGRCTFCREGLGQLYTHTKEITDGKGKNESLAMMEEIGNAMTFSCQCSVGLNGADFVLGSLKHFAGEYNEHIKKRNCPANVCSSFVSIYIDPNACEGCEECVDVCPAGCIEGKSGFIHMIDEFDCTKCGKCIDACEYDAIIQTTGRVPKLPTRLTKCGKFKKR